MTSYSHTLIDEGRHKLAAAMLRSRDDEQTPAVRAWMTKEYDRILKRWWPKTYGPRQPR